MGMDRRRKVELFEQIRREYRFGMGTIRGVAKQFGVHRRIVRQAIASAIEFVFQCTCDTPRNRGPSVT